jgi:hypothetical protein
MVNRPGNMEDIVYIKRLIRDTAWRTSKDGSHQYIVYHNLDYNYKYFFNLFCTLITIRGYDEYFQGRKYRYYDIEGYKYWIMPKKEWEKTIIINRVKK